MRVTPKRGFPQSPRRASAKGAVTPSGYRSQTLRLVVLRSLPYPDEDQRSTCYVCVRLQSCAEKLELSMVVTWPGDHEQVLSGIYTDHGIGKTRRKSAPNRRAQRAETLQQPVECHLVRDRQGMQN